MEGGGEQVGDVGGGGAVVGAGGAHHDDAPLVVVHHGGVHRVDGRCCGSGFDLCGGGLVKAESAVGQTGRVQGRDGHDRVLARGGCGLVGPWMHSIGGAFALSDGVAQPSDPIARRRLDDVEHESFGDGGAAGFDALDGQPGLGHPGGSEVDDAIRSGAVTLVSAGVIPGDVGGVGDVLTGQHQRTQGGGVLLRLVLSRARLVLVHAHGHGHYENNHDHSPPSRTHQNFFRNSVLKASSMSLDSI